MSSIERAPDGTLKVTWGYVEPSSEKTYLVPESHADALNEEFDQVRSMADVFKVAVIDALRLTHSEDVLRERLWNAVEDYQEAVLALEGESCQGKEKTR